MKWSCCIRYWNEIHKVIESSFDSVQSRDKGWRSIGATSKKLITYLKRRTWSLSHQSQFKWKWSWTSLRNLRFKLSCSLTQNGKNYDLEYVARINTMFIYFYNPNLLKFLKQGVKTFIDLDRKHTEEMKRYIKNVFPCFCKCFLICMYHLVQNKFSFSTYKFNKHI